MSSKMIRFFVGSIDGCASLQYYALRLMSAFLCVLARFEVGGCYIIFDDTRISNLSVDEVVLFLYRSKIFLSSVEVGLILLFAVIDSSL